MPNILKCDQFWVMTLIGANEQYRAALKNVCVDFFKCSNNLSVVWLIFILRVGYYDMLSKACETSKAIS